MKILILFVFMCSSCDKKRIHKTNLNEFQKQLNASFKDVTTTPLNNSDLKVFTSPRYKTRNTHGTGCTLSSAITTFFSCGKSIKKACELGIKYVNLAILSNPNYGKGHGPINHLNSIKLKKKFD